MTDIEGKEEIIPDDSTNVTEEESRFPFSVEQVKKAIQLLPDGYRMVFSLFMFEGWSHKQIAAEMSISESTSKSQYNRAKKKIREILNENLATNGI